MSTLNGVNIAEKVREVREDGFCVVKGRLPREALAECYQAFRPILDSFIAANPPNRGPGRYYVPVPMRPPFYNRAFFDDPVVNAVLEGVLVEGVTIQAFSTDSPVKGSEDQAWHSDMKPIFAEEPNLRHPPAYLAVNFPFLDVTPDHGPFEVSRGTHRMDKDEALAKVERGELPTEKVCLSMGDVLVRDPRCLHRGTKNVTDTPRIVAVVGYARRRFRWENVAMEPIPDETWRMFGERERELFKLLRPAGA